MNIDNVGVFRFGELVLTVADGGGSGHEDYTILVEADSDRTAVRVLIDTASGENITVTI